MGIPALIAGITALGSVGSVASGISQQRDAKKSAQQARKNAERQAKITDEEMNKANQKKANVFGSLERASNQGGSPTLLTGVDGVNKKDLTLGKNTLLGG